MTTRRSWCSRTLGNENASPGACRAPTSTHIPQSKCSSSSWWDDVLPQKEGFIRKENSCSAPHRWWNVRRRFDDVAMQTTEVRRKVSSTASRTLCSSAGRFWRSAARSALAAFGVLWSSRQLNLPGKRVEALIKVEYFNSMQNPS